MPTKKNLLHKISNELADFDSKYDYNKEYKLTEKDNPILWRYMDFTKFLSMLESKSLFFSKPKHFIDPYEGNFSKYDLMKRSDWDENLTEDFTLGNYVRELNEYAAVICWHMNDFESAAMWDLYLSSKEGVAIKTRFSKINESLKDNRFKIFSGKVQYIDYKKETASENVYETLFYKRRSFEHENEFRMMVFADPILYKNEGHNLNIYESIIDPHEGTKEFDTIAGANIKYDLSTLIEEIYIAPSAPPWFKDLVESVLAKYDLSKIKVIQSKLYEDLIY